MLINVHIKIYAGFFGIRNYTKKKKTTNKSVFAKWKKKVVENIFTVLNVCHFIEENTFKLCLFFLFL